MLKIYFLLARKSRSWYFLPIVIGLSVFAIFRRDLNWRGELAWGVESFAAVQVLILPALVATAAWDGLSFRRLQDLSTGPRRGRAGILWVLAAATPFLLVHILCLGFICWASLSAGNIGSVPIISMLAQLFSTLAAAACGVLIGYRVNKLIALPLSFILANPIAHWDYLQKIPTGFVSDGAGGTLVGLSPDPAAFGWRILFCLLCIALVALFMGLAGHSLGRKIALGGLGAALLLSSWGIRENIYEYSPGGSLGVPKCVTKNNTFCVPAQWARFADTGLDRIERSQKVLQDAGAKIPNRKYSAWTPASQPQDNWVGLIAPNTAGKLDEPRFGVSPTFSPSTCNLDDPKFAQYFDFTQAASAILVEYILHTDPGLNGKEDVPTFPAPLGDDRVIARAWVAKAATALTQCRPQDLPPLPNAQPAR